MSARIAISTVIVLVSTLVTSSIASSPWSATILKAEGGTDINGGANSVHGNQVIGASSSATYLWTFESGVWVTTSGFSSSAGVEIDSGRVIGATGQIWGWDSSTYPNGSALSLYPGFGTTMQLTGIGGDLVVGLVGGTGFTIPTPVVWTLGSAPSFSTSILSLPSPTSVVNPTSTDGIIIGGSHDDGGDIEPHATVWTGDGTSFVVLHPSWGRTSMVEDVGSGLAVGWVEYLNQDLSLVTQAAVWDSNHATYLLDPTPQGDSYSRVLGTHQNLHVGYADAGVAYQRHAYLWTTGEGNPISGGNPISLHAVLVSEFGTQFEESIAWDVYSEPGKVIVVGVGIESTGQTRPVVWTRQIDCDCPADFAEPFCVLNFFDLSTFMALFNAQDPAADLAAPSGVWNFFDVAAFLGHFNQGCIPG